MAIGAHLLLSSRLTRADCLYLFARRVKFCGAILSASRRSEWSRLVITVRMAEWSVHGRYNLGLLIDLVIGVQCPAYLFS